MQSAHDVPRIVATTQKVNPLDGKVVWAPAKSVWITAMWTIAIVGGYFTYSLEALSVFLIATAVTICGGHSLGMHRRLIHQSYECPLWLEYFLVHLGVLVGLAGPLGMVRTHDMRDWAQRQKNCHDYFAHRQPFLIDGLWQMHCDIVLSHPPHFCPEPRIANDRFYRFMEKTWMLQQLPWAILFWWWGGIAWVVWGICARVAVSVTGHWLIGYFAHNQGERHWHIEGASVQGYNVKFCGLITMGECWHNNHHAFPGSAKIGMQPGEHDPGWWVLAVLERMKLVWNLRLPADLPHRPELTGINDAYAYASAGRKSGRVTRNSGC
jgi:fatty-acid desaturase